MNQGASRYLLVYEAENGIKTKVPELFEKLGLQLEIMEGAGTDHIVFNVSGGDVDQIKLVGVLAKGGVEGDTLSYEKGKVAEEELKRALPLLGNLGFQNKGNNEVGQVQSYNSTIAIHLRGDKTAWDQLEILTKGELSPW